MHLTSNDILAWFSYHTDTPLDFLQPFFWGFFLVVLFFFSLFYKQIRLRNALLLVASLFFYYKTGGFYFWLLIFSTVADFYLAIRIEKSSRKARKTFWLCLSLVCNLGLLFYYKYAYLCIDFVNHLFKTEYIPIDYVAKLANSVSGSHFDITQILLPVGISFYVFQTLSYTIDVYRGKLRALSQIEDFALFVTFFPQLVAGPIVRATDFLPQIRMPYTLSPEDFGRALFLIMAGMTKKLLADYLALNLINRVFENSLAYTGFENLMGVYGFSIQIYFDFSGYTDIAIGLALLLGFVLPKNFDYPYKASNVTDFWRKWHISLSTWLRDYLYISLGGNQKASLFTYAVLPVFIAVFLLSDGVVVASVAFMAGFVVCWLLWLRNFKDVFGYLGLNCLALWGGLLYTQQSWSALLIVVFTFMMWLSAIWSKQRRIALSTDANLMLTMLLGGLWHGSSLRFVVWGGLHGLALGLHKFWLELTQNYPFFQKNKIYKFACQLLTFHFVCICWVFFRAKSLSVSGQQSISDLEVAQIILHRIVFDFQYGSIWEAVWGYRLVFGALLVAYTLHLLPQNVKLFAQNLLTRSPDFLKAFIIFLWIVLVYYQLRLADVQPFIYFQF